MSLAADARVFFGIWPNRELRTELQRRYSDIPITAAARLVPADNLHLTLHFIGRVDQQKLHCLRCQARKIVAQAFTMTIDYQGYFHKSAVVWLGCSGLSSRLIELHNNLGQALRHCDFKPAALSYQPHITVARNFRRAPPARRVKPLQWHVEDFSIIESKTTTDGIKYEILETYPLA